MNKKEYTNTVRRFFTEIWSKGDMDTVDRIIDPNFAFILAFARTDNIDTFKTMVKNNRIAFENLTYVPKDIVVDNSKGACWWSMSARHVGTWRNIPGSNKNVSIDGVTFFWFSPEGKLVRAVVENDVMGLMEQINGLKLAREN